MGHVRWPMGQWTDGELIKAQRDLLVEVAHLRKGTPAYEVCASELEAVDEELKDRRESRKRDVHHLRGVWHAAQGPEAGG